MLRSLLTSLLLSFSVFGVSQFDSLMHNSSLIVIEKQWNLYGEKLSYNRYLYLTDSIMHKIEPEILLKDTSMLILATKLYNTSTCLGFEFAHAHLDYISYYRENLIWACHQTLGCQLGGSNSYCPDYDLYIFGNLFYHENSRYQITCEENSE